MRSLKAVRAVLWALAIASASALLIAQSNRPPTSPILAATTDEAADDSDGTLPQLLKTPPFALVDHNGERFTSEHLKGRPWVGFIFLTQCPTGACPVMVAKMSDLEEALPAGVDLVSFSIDPDRDTPEAMTAYVEAVTGGTPSERWHLLTTHRDTPDAFEHTASLAARMGLGVAGDFTHATRFLLVDGDGVVRGTYGNEEEGAMTRLADDARTLLSVS